MIPPHLMNHKRFYFQNFEDSDLQTCDVWTIGLPGEGSFSNVVLASAIAKKVRVAWVRYCGKHDLLAGDNPIPGLFFSEEHRCGFGTVIRYRQNASVSVKLLKDEPLSGGDCVEFIDEHGERKKAIGWIE